MKITKYISKHQSTVLFFYTHSTQSTSWLLTKTSLISQAGNISSAWRLSYLAASPWRTSEP